MAKGASTVTLPAAAPPFPVVSPYRVRPDLSKLGSSRYDGYTAHHFIIDRDYRRYVTRKLELLAARADSCRCLEPDPPRQHTTSYTALHTVLWHLFERLATEHPHVFAHHPEGITHRLLGLHYRPTGGVTCSDPHAPLADLGGAIHRWLHMQRGLTRLADALALACQEDWLVVRDTPQGDRTELLHVCFPSHWRPRDKLGQDFSAVHAPVADNSLLQKAHPNLIKAMLTRGPFVRFAWGIVTDGRLEQHPDDAPPAPALPTDPTALAARCYLRVERQTTLALPDWGRALFTIRIYQSPLTAATKTPERRANLAGALASMTPETLAYKGLTALREPLLQWLERF